MFACSILRLMSHWVNFETKVVLIWFKDRILLFRNFVLLIKAIKKRFGVTYFEILMIFQQIYTVKFFQEPSDNSFIKKLNPWKNFAALILK